MKITRIVGVVLLLGITAVSGPVSADPPLPISNGVQRAAPMVCPSGTTPTVNSQGVAGAPSVVTTHAKVIAGNGKRYYYSVLSDADWCAEYGTATDTAPGTNAVGNGTTGCTSGALMKANTLYWEDAWPGNRLDAACVVGTCNISTVECNP